MTRITNYGLRFTFYALRFTLYKSRIASIVRKSGRCSFCLGGGKRRHCRYFLNKTVSSRITDYALASNYLNPFNPETKIGFVLPEAGNLTLKIFTITGQLVRTLASGNFDGGRHELVWDAKDDRGAQVATGIYLYQLVAHRQNGEAAFLLMSIVK